MLGEYLEVFCTRRDPQFVHQSHTLSPSGNQATHISRTQVQLSPLLASTPSSGFGEFRNHCVYLLSIIVNEWTKIIPSLVSTRRTLYNRNYPAEKKNVFR